MNIQDDAADEQDTATRAAAERLAAVEPEWFATVRADELLGLERRVLLHAGPGFSSPDLIPPPLLNAAVVALLFEGEADSEPHAREMILAGDVALCPAQDHGVVTPLAAVVSSSMWLHAVRDTKEGAPGMACAPVSEGTGPAQRFGLAGPAVVERLTVVHREFAPALAALDTRQVDVFALAAAGLQQGDELHARVGVASELLATRLAALGLGGDAEAFSSANPQSFLNLWMAVCRCMLDAAATQRSGALLVAAGGNGREFGVQVSGSPGHWRAATAEPPQGPALAPALAGKRRLPAIGDSAVIDAVGFGALALDAAPAFAAVLGSDVVTRLQQAAEHLLTTPHPGLARRVGVNAGRVSGRAMPGVCLAALDASGEAGLVGRGISFHPLSLY